MSRDYFAEARNDGHIQWGRGARLDMKQENVHCLIPRFLVWIATTGRTFLVSPLRTNHTKTVDGTDRISRHFWGRAIDIIRVDGKPVSRDNDAAKALARTIARYGRSRGVVELASPWAFSGPGIRGFSKDHEDHMHIGFRP